MLLLVNGEIMAPLLTVCCCVSTGGVPELHQGAAGEREQAVYLWNQRLHPHLHQPNGTNNCSPSLFNTRTGSANICWCVGITMDV